MPPPLFVRTAHLFDQINTERHLERFERLAVYVAAVGFLVHLGMIAWARNLPAYISIMESMISRNYLSAIYTPFSVLLYYEVYLLIVALPKSMTKAVGKQFEIVSLIIIRGVFKDISYIGEDSFDLEHLDVLYPALIDMGGSLIMFFLVGVYYHLSQDRHARKSSKWIGGDLNSFVIIKKNVAMFLTLSLITLSVWHVGDWIIQSLEYYRLEAKYPAQTTFYQEMFTIMIFADIFILIVSFVYADNYELTFRNAGYVISTLLIRFGFSAEKPFDLLFYITSILFGVLLLLIYRYFTRYAARDSQTHELASSTKSNGS
jgi:hypothetical protein